MDFLQKDSGDLDIVNNQLVIVRGADEVRQRIIQRLRTIQGEWFLDRRVGVPYFGNIFVKQVVPSNVNAIIQTTIIETPGVFELISYEADLSSARVLTIAFSARVTDNEIIEITETI